MNSHFCVKRELILTLLRANKIR